jgi:hypothetical protein
MADSTALIAREDMKSFGRVLTFLLTLIVFVVFFTGKFSTAGAFQGSTTVVSS